MKEVFGVIALLLFMWFLGAMSGDAGIDNGIHKAVVSIGKEVKAIVVEIEAGSDEATHVEGRGE